MNLPGDYDDLDMRGLDRDWWESHVPAEAQKTLYAAFPELRLIWNCRKKFFQCVHRQPGHIEAYYGGCGVMLGWSIIPGNYEPPLRIDDVVNQLRAREYVATEWCKANGYADVADAADKIYDALQAERKKERGARIDEFFGVNPDTETVGTFHPAQARSKILTGVSAERVAKTIERVKGPALREAGT